MTSQYLADKIREHSRQHPDKIAVKYDNQFVTYQELESLSNQLAYFLHDKVKKSKNIVIILDRTPELIQVILGVLKCGLTFVPLDPIFPDSRVEKVLKETGSQWVIISSHHYKKFSEVIESEKKHVLFVDGNIKGVVLSERIFCIDTARGKENLEFTPIYTPCCYIYYTSGSMGNPKAVLGNQKSLFHFLEWEIKEFGINENFIISQLTNSSYDPFLRDIFIPLMAGATCCIADNRLLKAPAQLIRWIRQNCITLIHIGPALFKVMMSKIENNDCLGNLKYILLSGELLRGNDVRKFFDLFNDRIQLVNLYGPTETTLAKLFYRINKNDVSRVTIPVGKPINGAQAVVLDKNMKKSLINNIGEIYIRTPFLSSGYLNGNDLNKEVFLINPFTNNPGDIIYKTGDLGRLLPDGNIEWIGRVDQNVKSSEISIELRRIENQLLSYSEIKEAVVLAADNGKEDKTICAYIAADKNTDLSHLRECLSRDLPGDMIPDHFVFLEGIPLTFNGKLDRKRLPGIEIKARNKYIAPGNDIEKKLVEIWSQILNLDKEIIGIDTSFFELGGHSLKVIDVFSKIHEVFGVRTSLSGIFESPTIKGLAKKIMKETKNMYFSIKPVEKRDYYPLPDFLSNVVTSPPSLKTSYNTLKTFLIRGKIDKEGIERVFKTIIAQHEILRTSFHVINGEVVQRIKDKVDFNLSFSKCDEKLAMKKLENGDYVKPFDLSRPPLFRAGILQIDDAKGILYTDMHHIITDAISNGIFFKDILVLYGGGKLKPLAIQFKDYAVFLSKMLTREAMETHEKYWLTKLKNFKLTRVPYDFPKPAGSLKYETRKEHLVIDEHNFKKIDKFCAEHNVTKYTFFISIIKIILAQEANQNDITILTRISTRNFYELNQVMGSFLNNLFIRSSIKKKNTFLDTLLRVNKVIIEAMNNSLYPFYLLPDKVGAKKNLQKKDLKTIMFNYNPPQGESGNPSHSINFKIINIFRRPSGYEISIYIIERQKDINIDFLYNKVLYRKERIKRIVDTFANIMKQVLEDVNIKLVNLSKAGPGPKYL